MRLKFRTFIPSLILDNKSKNGETQSLYDPNLPILGIPLYAMALNWDLLHARVNIHYKPWIYEKEAQKD